MRKIVSLVAVLAISLVGIAALSSGAQAATTSSSDLSGQGAMMGTLDRMDSGAALMGTPPPPHQISLNADFLDSTCSLNPLLILKKVRG